MSKLMVREACRRRMPLDGADAQCLEHALTITERERDEARNALEVSEKEHGNCGMVIEMQKREVARLRDLLVRVKDWCTPGYHDEAGISVYENVRAELERVLGVGNPKPPCPTCKEKE